VCKNPSISFLCSAYRKKLRLASEIVSSSQREYLAACRNRTCRFTSSIMRVFAPVVLGTVSRGEDTGPNVSPCAIVERLFLYVPTRHSCGSGKICTRSYLTPKDICIGVFIEVRSNLENGQRSPTVSQKTTYQIVREGRKLFHATNRYILNALRLALLKK
jgi:hypothetical protein